MAQAVHQRGLVLVTSLGVMVILAILGSSFLVRSLHENQTTDRSRSQSRALFLAEAAVDTALSQLSGGNTGNVPTIPISGGTYWAEVALVAPSTYQVTGHGLHTSQQRDIAVVTQQTAQSVFQFAMFGSQSLGVSGNATTDSYDSSLGPYDPATAGSNGDIGTNSTASGGVTLSGTYFIDGQIAVGPNVSNPESLVTGYNPSFVNGNPDVASQSTALQMPAVSPPSGLSCQTNLTVSGSQTVTLPSGTYCSGNVCCINNLSVSGGGTLTASSAVTVYVTSAFKASGNSELGVANDPTMFQLILVSPQQATIEGDVTGNTKFYGGIYAPTGDIDIKGNAEIFGSVIAQEVEISGNAQVHYDKAMAGVGPAGSFEIDVVEWHDLN